MGCSCGKTYEYDPNFTNHYLESYEGQKITFLSYFQASAFYTINFGAPGKQSITDTKEIGKAFFCNPLTMSILIVALVVPSLVLDMMNLFGGSPAILGSLSKMNNPASATCIQPADFGKIQKLYSTQKYGCACSGFDKSTVANLSVHTFYDIYGQNDPACDKIGIDNSAEVTKNSERLFSTYRESVHVFRAASMCGEESLSDTMATSSEMQRTEFLKQSAFTAAMLVLDDSTVANLPTAAEALLALALAANRLANSECSHFSTCASLYGEVLPLTRMFCSTKYSNLTTKLDNAHMSDFCSASYTSKALFDDVVSMTHNTSKALTMYQINTLRDHCSVVHGWHPWVNTDSLFGIANIHNSNEWKNPERPWFLRGVFNDNNEHSIGYDDPQSYLYSVVRASYVRVVRRTVLDVISSVLTVVISSYLIIHSLFLLVAALWRCLPQAFVCEDKDENQNPKTAQLAQRVSKVQDAESWYTFVRRSRDQIEWWLFQIILLAFVAVFKLAFLWSNFGDNDAEAVCQTGGVHSDGMFVRSSGPWSKIDTLELSDTRSLMSIVLVAAASTLYVVLSYFIFIPIDAGQFSPAGPYPQNPTALQRLFYGATVVVFVGSVVLVLVRFADVADNWDSLVKNCELSAISDIYDTLRTYVKAAFDCSVMLGFVLAIFESRWFFTYIEDYDWNWWAYLALSLHVFIVYAFLWIEIGKAENLHEWSTSNDAWPKVFFWTLIGIGALLGLFVLYTSIYFGQHVIARPASFANQRVTKATVDTGPSATSGTRVNAAPGEGDGIGFANSGQCTTHARLVNMAKYQGAASSMRVTRGSMERVKAVLKQMDEKERLL